VTRQRSGCETKSPRGRISSSCRAPDGRSIDRSKIGVPTSYG
jgi:hypothetical protein